MKILGVVIFIILLLIVLCYTNDTYMLLYGILLYVTYIMYSMAHSMAYPVLPNNISESNTVHGGKPMKEDDFQTNLESELVRIYENFNVDGNFDPTIPSKLDDYLVPFSIKDNECSFVKNIKIYDEDDDRHNQIAALIKNTIKYALNNNLPVPDTILYVYISDRFPFSDSDFVKFPIFLMAKPKNIDLPIIPDGTFEMLNVNKKYTGESMNWDQVKEKILEQNTKHNKRIKTMYFKGTDTTKDIHNIRNMLLEFSKNTDTPLDIHLNAWTKFENVWNFNKYTHLLNLPGHYPWSNRFKYILLMDSVVINVDVRTESLDPVYSDAEYISFIDYVAKPNIDYVNIPYTFYRFGKKCTNDTLKEKVRTMQKKENEKLRNAIMEAYNNSIKNPKKYNKMKQHAIETVSELTLENIYRYMYKAICFNAKLGI